MKTTKLLLATIAMLVALGGFAQSEVSTMAGPCVHLRTPYRCANYPTGECFWDYADGRCENRRNHEDICSSLCYSDCIYNDHACFWDEDDQRCERY